MHGTERHRAPLSLLLTLAAAVLVALPGSAMAGWDGTQDVRLGDKISAEFGAADASVHEFTFFAPKGTFVDVKAKADAGLTLGFELWSDLGEQVPLAGGTALGFKKIVIPTDGFYMLHVKAASGSGNYYLTTKGKFPSKLTVDGAADVPCGALAGAFIQASVKPSQGSAATATIVGVKYPGGAMTVTPGTTVKVADPLPVNGTYTVDITITGAGNVTTSIKFKNPKFKRSWAFGLSENPTGAPQGIRAEWLASRHADYSSEAFRHWDSKGAFTGTDVACAKCHSSYGFQDWVGSDGTAFESLDSTSVALGSTVDCDACHNSGTAGLDTVLFPSGERVDGLGAEARCMQCHQGRESTASMDTALAGLPDDEVDAAVKFKNVHYLPAAASLYGRSAAVGYQYAGQVYNGRFYHVKDLDSCVECHDPHSTELRMDACATCHVAADGLPVATVADLSEVRMTRTIFDYDGDGNTTEGVAGELEGMRAALYAAIQAYAEAKGTAIVYDPATYPYFMKATGGSYNVFTPNLARACYNLQFATKDPGLYAHNARYGMELLYDSYMSLQNSGVYAPLATVLVRNEAGGHFDATSMAYRDWDDSATASASCARCHGPDGFEFYVTNTTTTAQYNPSVGQQHAEGMRCESCHVDNADFAGDPALRSVKAVWWPGATTALANTTDDPSFICLTCHQGRESKKTLDDRIASGSLSFRNIHYLPAGATLFGTDAKVGYEYTGKTYVGKWTHKGDTSNQCTFCHMQEGSHSFKPEAGATCQICHGSTAIENYRLKTGGGNDTTDYDGDGSTTETLMDEIAPFADRIYARLKVLDPQILYDSHSYPYWFKDTNGDGVSDGSFTAWTAPMTKAAFNFQFFNKEPGAWAHNRKYMMQLLYDSLEDLGGSTAGLTRP